MGISDARKAANARYLAKFERINLTVTAEQKEAIKAAAESVGKSVTSYILYKVFSDTVQDSITQDTNDTVQDTPRSLSDLPQPPDSIPKDNRTALVVWMLSHGWTGDDVAKYFDDNSVTAETVAQLSGVLWDILKDSATLEQPQGLPLPPDDVAAAPVEVLAQWLHDHGYAARQIREYLKDNRK